MRNIGFSDLKMDAIEELGDGSYYYNRNIKRITINHEDRIINSWECERILCTGTPSYESVVDQVVKCHYPSGEDMAIMRKGIVDPNNKEFVNYNQFVEDVKKEVSEVFRTRRYI